MTDLFSDEENNDLLYALRDCAGYVKRIIGEERFTRERLGKGMPREAAPGNSYRALQRTSRPCLLNLSFREGGHKRGAR